MRTTHPPILPKRYLLRLIVWAEVMVVWAATVLLCERAATRRHMRQRYGFISIEKLTRLVRNVMIVRAAQFLPRRSPRPWRAAARSGFRHRPLRMRLRSVAGSRLRRFLQAGSFTRRLTRLVHIVRNLDAFVRKFLLRRAENGVNRLSPLIVARPPQDAIQTRPAQTPALADSS
jgi:hypothetical protein